MANKNNQTSVQVKLVVVRQVKQMLVNAVELTAKEFVKSTIDKMANSKPRGRVYYSKRKGFHRASAPGQRPAIDTTTLYKAVDYKVDARYYQAMAYIKPLMNPENGVSAQRYAEILQVGLNRQIMTKRDAGAFKKVLKGRVARLADAVFNR